ncbi:MAG: hypothetical protein KH704_07035 [Clostridiales bacterium]|nr:hypothetical protein [Clostridiales bacterium]
MECNKIKETLEKQLQLLSERSTETEDNRELVALTNAMVTVTHVLAQQ